MIFFTSSDLSFSTEEVSTLECPQENRWDNLSVRGNLGEDDSQNESFFNA